MACATALVATIIHGRGRAFHVFDLTDQSWGIGILTTVMTVIPLIIWLLLTIIILSDIRIFYLPKGSSAMTRISEEYDLELRPISRIVERFLAAYVIAVERFKREYNREMNLTAFAIIAVVHSYFLNDVWLMPQYVGIFESFDFEGMMMHPVRLESTGVSDYILINSVSPDAFEYETKTYMFKYAAAYEGFDIGSKIPSLIQQFFAALIYPIERIISAINYFAPMYLLTIFVMSIIESRKQRTRKYVQLLKWPTLPGNSEDDMS